MLYQFPQHLLQNYWQQSMVAPPSGAGSGNAFAPPRPNKGALSPAMPQAAGKLNAFAHPAAMFALNRWRKNKMGMVKPGPQPQYPGGGGY
jgi:hypothetical protein